MGGAAAKERRRQQRLQLQEQETKQQQPTRIKENRNSKVSSEKTSGIKTQSSPHQKSRVNTTKRPSRSGSHFPSKNNNKKNNPRVEIKTKDKKNEKTFVKPKHLKRKLEQIADGVIPESTSADNGVKTKQEVLDEMYKWEEQKKLHLSRQEARSNPKKNKKRNDSKNDQDKEKSDRKRARTASSFPEQQLHEPQKQTSEDEPDLVDATADIKQKEHEKKPSNQNSLMAKATVTKEASSSVLGDKKPDHDRNSEKNDSSDEPKAKHDVKTEHKESSSDSNSDSDSDSDSDSEDEVTEKRQRGKRRRGRQDTSKKEDGIEKERTDKISNDSEKASKPDESVESESKDAAEKTTEKNGSAKRYCKGRKPVTDFVVGQKYTGTVIYVKSFGVFFDIGCHSDAFCHVSRLRDDFVESPEALFKEGDKVDNVRVVEIDRRQKRLTVSLQSEAMVETEKESIASRKQRLEKQKAKKNKSQGFHGSNDNTSKPIPPPHSTVKTQAPLQHEQLHEETAYSGNETISTKLEADMTPAELKRSRKLARRAERRAAQEDQ